ncbi:MAG: hypothetical protein ACP5Q1_09715 [Anaerolineae bacterium]
MSPLLILSAIIATLYAAVFHFFWGSSLRQFLICWLAALLGFGIGQAIASAFVWHDILIGELHLLPASFACWLSMALARRIKL